MPSVVLAKRGQRHRELTGICSLWRVEFLMVDGIFGNQLFNMGKIVLDVGWFWAFSTEGNRTWFSI